MISEKHTHTQKWETKTRKATNSQSCYTIVNLIFIPKPNQPEMCFFLKYWYRPLVQRWLKKKLRRNQKKNKKHDHWPLKMMYRHFQCIWRRECKRVNHNTWELSHRYSYFSSKAKRKGLTRTLSFPHEEAEHQEKEAVPTTKRQRKGLSKKLKNNYN